VSSLSGIADIKLNVIGPLQGQKVLPLDRRL
jgi:hypothetical protein